MYIQNGLGSTVYSYDPNAGFVSSEMSSPSSYSTLSNISSGSVHYSVPPVSVSQSSNVVESTVSGWGNLSIYWKIGIIGVGIWLLSKGVK